MNEENDSESAKSIASKLGWVRRPGTPADSANAVAFYNTKTRIAVKRQQAETWEDLVEVVNIQHTQTDFSTWLANRANQYAKEATELSEGDSKHEFYTNAIWACRFADVLHKEFLSNHG